jgi:hypothetical protein
MMKSIVIVLGVFLVFCTTTAIAQPRLTILPNSTIDLGDLYAGDKVEHIVTVKNTGTDTLRIQNVKASCGCTSALLKNSSGVIAPGSSAQLSIVFNTKSQIGKVTKSVTITSNDSKNPTTQIRFTAYVQERFKVSPPMLMLYERVGDTILAGTVTLKNLDKSRTIKILGVNTKMPNCTFSLKKKQLKPMEETQLDVRYRTHGEEYLNDNIQIITDLMSQNTFTIYVQKKMLRK